MLRDEATAGLDFYDNSRFHYQVSLVQPHGLSMKSDFKGDLSFDGEPGALEQYC